MHLKISALLITFYWFRGHVHIYKICRT